MVGGYGGELSGQPEGGQRASRFRGHAFDLDGQVERHGRRRRAAPRRGEVRSRHPESRRLVLEDTPLLEPAE